MQSPNQNKLDYNYLLRVIGGLGITAIMGITVWAISVGSSALNAKTIVTMFLVISTIGLVAVLNLVGPGSSGQQPFNFKELVKQVGISVIANIIAAFLMRLAGII